jgi:hypothetical protein
MSEKPVNKMHANARRRAKKRDHPCTITKAWIARALDKGVCQLTGLPFYEGIADDHDWWTHPRAPSLHRVDPSQGYTPENTVVVVWQYNCAMNHWPEQYLHELALAVLGIFPRGARNDDAT